MRSNKRTRPKRLQTRSANILTDSLAHQVRKTPLFA